jgi:1-acyl-sn-glycerol-3-phosphate acyltransferase
MLWLARWLRTLIAWLDLTLFTVAMMLLARLPLVLLTRFYPALFHSWCRCFVRALGVELRLHQRNLHPLPGQYILIANHPSAFEDVGIPALFPVASLAKEEVRNWWFVGRIAVAAGTLFVHRESKSSRQAALQDMIAALKTGKSIAVYPEGGCKGRRLWNKFLFGAFTASLETGVPIVPVFLHYEAQETFEWRPHEHLLSKIWSIMTAPNRHANYHVYDAIDPAGFTSREEYSAQVYALYQRWQQRYLE